MAGRKNLSLTEKATLVAAGVTSFIAAREPITTWYTDVFAERAEFNDYLDVVLAAGHITAAGIVAATAIGTGVAYATKKGIDYLHQRAATPVVE